MIVTLRELTEKTSFELEHASEHGFDMDTLVSLRSDGSVGIEGGDGVLVYSSDVDDAWIDELKAANLLEDCILEGGGR